jgi:hypothetical protein
VRARRVLLDALVALEGQREAVVLVGAQAVYLHTGAAQFAVAEYTTDADLLIEPSRLRAVPRLIEAMTAGGFTLDPHQPGTWIGAHSIEVDLIVPDVVAGAGRRAARISGHGKHAAKRALGLEAALVDREKRQITALDRADARSFEILVAGPAALLVAKLFKIGERQGKPRRLENKDALDAFRILQAIGTEELVRVFGLLLPDEVSRDVTTTALAYLQDLFGTPDSPGVRMLTNALPMEDAGILAASCAALAMDLLVEVRRRSGE